jgi:multidrug resistance efflux pump
MSKAPVRVRGMNAAASHSTPPQGEPNESVFAFLDDDTTELSTVRTKEHVGGVGASRVAENHRRQRFPHASVRQLTLAVALLAAGLLVAKFTYGELAGGPTGYVGTVEPTNSVGLDFTQTGQVDQILVKPGQKVTKGQTLATLSQGSAQATLQDAEAVLAADQTVVQALQSPTLSDAEKQSLQAQVNNASTQLSNAEQKSQDAVNQANSLVSQAQTALTNATNTYNADNAQYNSECAGGNSGNRNNQGTGNGNEQSQASNSTCSALLAQVQKDSSEVSTATIDLTNVKANAAQLEQTASNSESNAQNALTQSQTQEAAQNAPASGATISAAEANVATAQTTVDQDKAALSALTLVSPIDGTVADVGGIVGDLDGTSGVHGFSGPNSLQAGGNSGPAFSLFPSQTNSGTSNSSSSSTQPLIWLVGPQQYAQAQVSETEISNLHVGSAATITVNALGKTADATVSQINPIPVNQGGSVEYEVTLTSSSWPTGTLIGMSLNVVFP